MKSRDRFKELILNREKSTSLKKLLQKKSSDLGDPALEGYALEYAKYLAEQHKQIRAAEAGENDEFIEELEIEELDELDDEELEEIEELEDDSPATVDIDKLSEIERKIVTILQYLNLELYEQNQIKTFIMTNILSDLEYKNLNPMMKERVMNVIKELVNHEFRELSHKKKARRKSLIKDTMTIIEVFLNKKLEIHKKNRTPKTTKFQEDNFKKFVYEDIVRNKLSIIKKDKKINYDEFLFLKKVIKRYINSQYTKQIKNRPGPSHL